MSKAKPVAPHAMQGAASSLRGATVQGALALIDLLAREWLPPVLRAPDRPPNGFGGSVTGI